ncbi:MAG: Adaptive-response sensory-kinase SasA [Steroidobacteraceae bacterium]|nr:Adaptive-response sensory-kinase SasA [Steroidobacteraceae bacterium]
MRARRSLEGRLLPAAALVAIASAAVAVLAMRWLTPWVAVLCGALAGLAAGLWLARAAVARWRGTAVALRDGIASLRDRDFSVSITRTSDDELGELVAAYNSLGAALRRERVDLYQRELLLDTVIQATPLALLLTNAAGNVIYSNVAARELFGAGRKLEGFALDAVLERAPAPLREALSGSDDRLFTVEADLEPQVYHLSQRRFLLNTQPHRLLLLKRLTRELAAQEVAVWKKVIRVIAHELNNSLAPISSLAHSGRLLLAERSDERLERVFATIEDRAAHLASFIDGYARFAKLPTPRPVPLDWDAVIVRLQAVLPFALHGGLPRARVLADPVQIEQVAINLLKNAAESGSPSADVELSIREHRGGVLLEVADRGSGLSDEALGSALVPFFSTKASGTGLGLTICREIVDAHGGHLTLANREGGGARASVWLPLALEREERR